MGVCLSKKPGVVLFSKKKVTVDQSTQVTYRATGGRASQQFSGIKRERRNATAIDYSSEELPSTQPRRNSYDIVDLPIRRFSPDLNDSEEFIESTANKITPLYSSEELAKLPHFKSYQFSEILERLFRLYCPIEVETLHQSPIRKIKKDGEKVPTIGLFVIYPFYLNDLDNGNFDSLSIFNQEIKLYNLLIPIYLDTNDCVILHFFKKNTTVYLEFCDPNKRDLSSLYLSSSSLSSIINIFNPCKIKHTQIKAIGQRPNANTYLAVSSCIKILLEIGADLRLENFSCRKIVESIKVKDIMSYFHHLSEHISNKAINEVVTALVSCNFFKFQAGSDAATCSVDFLEENEQETLSSSFKQNNC